MKKILIIGFLARIMLVNCLAGETGESSKTFIRLFSDRTLYVSGETIRFSAVLFNPASGCKILYAELIAPEGLRVNAGKYLLSEGIAGGCLKIPSDLITGTYYLRSYTRDMRNGSPTAYAYVPLTIVNPSNGQVNHKESGRPPATFLDSVISGTIRIGGLAGEYAIRQNVEFQIQPMDELHPVYAVFVSVVPENTLDARIFHPDIDNQEQDTGSTFYPETRGITLTGRISMPDNKGSLAGKLISLSLLGEKDITAMETNENGRFFFTLPDETGQKDIFLSSEENNGVAPSLFIDNDYCTKPVNLPDPKFRISAGMENTMLKMANNEIILENFLQPSGLEINNGDNKAHLSFYGEPTGLLNLDQYILLPTLQEYFDEISHEVRVRQNKGGKYFRFVAGEAGRTNNPPLILVDFVVINDMQKVLAIAPQKVARIETIDKPYIKGNITYGGIVSILTRDGDFAGIDLPASGMFLKYDLFAVGCPEISTSTGAAEPDPRNTLLWYSALTPQPDAATSLKFQTADTKGTYQVIVRYVLKDGRVISRNASFEVK